MTAQVQSSTFSPPTIPSWYSEMLPLSFDLGMEIGKFRRLVDGKLNAGRNKGEIIDFINEYLYVDRNSANAIYDYLKEQYDYASIPTDKKILIEYYNEENKKYIIFHSIFGRRVNDCLSRIIAYAVGKVQGRDVEVGVSDNAFYIASDKSFPINPVLKLIKSARLRELAELAINRTEILTRRFRHCAGRALMILRQYLGHHKRVGRQQTAAMILINAVKRISKDFPILKEAKREVLEDFMDIKNATAIIEGIEKDKIKLEEIHTLTPSPFGFNIVLQGYSDILKMEDRIEFLKKLHTYVLAKIGKNGNK
jgi:ATP-dependent Lhr-like helicase